MMVSTLAAVAAGELKRIKIHALRIDMPAPGAWDVLRRVPSAWRLARRRPEQPLPDPLRWR
jgi:hypothetical protein